MRGATDHPEPLPRRRAPARRPLQVSGHNDTPRLKRGPAGSSIVGGVKPFARSCDLAQAAHAPGQAAACATRTARATHAAKNPDPAATNPDSAAAAPAAAPAAAATPAAAAAPATAAAAAT